MYAKMLVTAVACLAAFAQAQETHPVPQPNSGNLISYVGVIEAEAGGKYLQGWQPPGSLVQKWEPPVAVVANAGESITLDLIAGENAACKAEYIIFGTKVNGT